MILDVGCVIPKGNAPIAIAVGDGALRFAITHPTNISIAKLSEASFSQVWDNSEDAVYDNL